MSESVISGKDRLFLATLGDLAGCVRKHDEYQNLRVAGLLRLLLLDGFPLVDQVNRQRRHRLVFRVGPHYGTAESPDFPPVLRSLRVAAVLDGITPLPGIKRVEEVTRARFLALYVILVEGHPITVRELILHMAHVDGVMHAGDATRPADQALLSLRRAMGFGNTPMIYRTLRAIGIVVLAALSPLHQSIAGPERSDA